MTKNDKNKTALDEIPLAIFDTIKTIKKITLPSHISLAFAHNDFESARNFLREYDGNEATYNSYRREVERLLQWSWLIQKKSILQLSRLDIENYFNFCRKPPLHWITIAKMDLKKRQIIFSPQRFTGCLKTRGTYTLGLSRE
jgi:hypothetical protein